MNIETQKRFLIRIGFWAVVILLMLVGFQYVLPVVLSFVMAFLIAALLDRPIRFLAKRLNGKRVLPAIGLTLLFYLLAAVLFGFLGLRVLMFVWETVRSCRSYTGIRWSLLWRHCSRISRTGWMSWTLPW